MLEVPASEESDVAKVPAAARRWPQPWIFVLMPLPFGIFQGYIQTPLPYLLRQMGYTVDRIGSMVAFVLLPMALYFLWSPVVDFWLRRRTWMIVFAALSGAALFTSILLLPRHTELATSLLFGGFCLNLLTTAAGGGILATTLDEQGKAKGAAWMQGGMLTASALGGAALLYFSKRMPLPVAGTIAALMVALPATIALTIPEPAPETATKELLKTCRTMGREIRETLFSWKSLPGLLLLVSPVGSGSAQSLFAAMAKDYQVSEHGVMLLNGLLGGVLMMLGAFAAVIVPAHWDRRIAYGAAGFACSLSGIYLALAPMTPMVYFLGVGFYLLTTGLCYAFFLGVVMYTLGAAGQSASSRYTILVSLGNLPVVYMTKVEGWGFGMLGPKGVPALDAAGNLLVALCVAVWVGSQAMGRKRIVLDAEL
ncbi:PAT family beta-lactamase induction signal transducer AmpG [Granulicella aggregans]|uniref:PAT family beta-lactamase induction signal transducer AmpG n=1 Tax=Granulicella aggregans TaxID=474949 RepID=A0A7W7ZAY6_9BACT|nr:MFS transporter [Granulicella aggregans]MBB5056535.1 PAT family beta-lactamase induction signal transducer AmpG [Granulicella aggregans]